MKVLSGSLILLLLLHLQCGGSCLIEAFGGAIHEAATSTQPPCHKQGSNPTPSNRQPPHDADSPCNQGQLIESRTYNSGKVVLEFAAVLPPTITLMMAPDLRLRAMTPGDPSFVLPLPIPTSILRI